MSIQEFPDGRIKVRWRIGDRQPSKTFTDKHAPTLKERRELAKAFERERVLEAELGLVPIVDMKKTVREVVHEFVRVFVSQKEPKTQALYRSLWNAHLAPAFGGHPIALLTTAQIEDWLIASKAGVVTKRKAIVLLGQVFTFAMKRNYVRANPVPLVEKPKLPKREPVVPPTPLEVERIRKAFLEAKRPLEATLTSLLAYSGVRVKSEGLALTYGDVRERTLLVRAPKTNSVRAVDLLEPLAEDLRWWMGRQLAFGGAPLFPDRHGKFWTNANYNSWRRRVWDEVAPGFPPKNLRHTFVSLLMRDQSYTRREIADQAGHSLDVQDDVYSHVFAELRGTGSAEGAIREARAEVFGERAGTEARDVGT